MNTLLSIGELAAKLSIHPDTLRKWELLGHITSIKTIGGHRRYVQSEADHILHRMNLQGMFSAFSDPTNGWNRRDSYLSWKKFTEFHDCNPKVKNHESEVFKQQGAKSVLAILDQLGVDDWNDIDKIDNILEPIYVWYRESKSAIYQPLLDVVSPVYNLTPELTKLAYKMDGVHHVLWGFRGIACGGEESVMKGNGSFPSERRQMEIDRANGWDGKGSFVEQREKLMRESFEKRHSKNQA